MQFNGIRFRVWYIWAVLAVAIVPVVFSLIADLVYQNNDLTQDVSKLYAGIAFSLSVTTLLFVGNTILLRTAELKFPWSEAKVWQRLVFSFASTNVFALTAMLAYTWLWVKVYPEWYGNQPLEQVFFQNVLIGNTLTIIVSAVFEGRELFLKWKRQMIESEQLKQAKLETELNFLRHQINPHFLFNSLNSIFFMIKKSPDQAQSALMQFSEMLSHQLYDTREQWVSLDREVAFLQNFIALEKIRQADSLNLEEHWPTSPMSNWAVPPLLLGTYVENALKHGFKSGLPTYQVYVSLHIANGTLHFTCKNDYQEVKAVEKGGIGLENAQKRLDLLFGKSYTLIIQRDAHTYSVELSFPLKAID